MDSSDKDQRIAHSETDISSTNGSDEPEDDLRSIVPANKRVESMAESGSSTGEEDVQLLIEGHGSITNSKQRLRIASPYFATLLKYNENHIRMIPPPNVHLDCYVAVLHSVANNEPPAVDESNMWDFLVLARYFLMKPLEDTCCRVIRQALPTLTMDELCLLWRNAHADHCDEVKKWSLAGIVRNLDQAGQSVEFLNLDFEEMLVLLHDDEFLPLFEKDVYKAIVSWCDHNPEQRMTRAILDVLLAEINWDHFDIDSMQQLVAGAPPPLQSVLENSATSSTDRKKPKRAVERHLIFGHETFIYRGWEKSRTRELIHFDCLRGTLRVWNAPAARTVCTKGSWQYLTHDLNVDHPTVIFLKKSDRSSRDDVVAVVNLVDGNARVIGNGLSEACYLDMNHIMGGYDVMIEWCYSKAYGFLGLTFNSGKWERKPAPFQCRDLQGVASCSLELPGAGGKRIAHLLTFFRRDDSNEYIPDSVIVFCEEHKDSSLTFSCFRHYRSHVSARRLSSAAHSSSSRAGPI